MGDRPRSGRRILRRGKDASIDGGEIRRREPARLASLGALGGAPLWRRVVGTGVVRLVVVRGGDRGPSVRVFERDPLAGSGLRWPGACCERWRAGRPRFESPGHAKFIAPHACVRARSTRLFACPSSGPARSPARALCRSVRLLAAKYSLPRSLSVLTSSSSSLSFLPHGE